MQVHQLTPHQPHQFLAFGLASISFLTAVVHTSVTFLEYCCDSLLHCEMPADYILTAVQGIL